MKLTALSLVLAAVVVALTFALMAAVSTYAPAGQGPWPNPTLTPPAVEASR